MHGEVDRPCKQRLLDLLGEQPLPACLGQRAVLDTVTLGADHRNIGLDTVCSECGLYHACLRQRQRAPPRADAQS